jgi:hypothetical protein
MSNKINYPIITILETPGLPKITIREESKWHAEVTEENAEYGKVYNLTMARNIMRQKQFDNIHGLRTPLAEVVGR